MIVLIIKNRNKVKRISETNKFFFHTFRRYTERLYTL